MNGKIAFNSVEDMAAFLKAFTGSTAVFEAYQDNNSNWIIKFNGGC